jgi:hypothetical protein
VEQVEDDYGTDDYDDIESDVSSAIEYSDEELEDEDSDDLDDFIESDESDKSEDESETNGPRRATAPVPVKKRGPGVRGRLTPRGTPTASPRIAHAFPVSFADDAATAEDGLVLGDPVAPARDRNNHRRGAR